METNEIKYSGACLSRKEINRFVRALREDKWTVTVNGQWITVIVPFGWISYVPDVRFLAKVHNMIEY